MNLKEAIHILDIATHPSSCGKLNRADYAACEQAIQLLVQMDKEADAKAAAPEPDEKPA